MLDKIINKNIIPIYGVKIQGHGMKEGSKFRLAKTT